MQTVCTCKLLFLWDKLFHVTNNNFFIFAVICRDTYHDRFECDGIIVHCAVWCDEIPDCDDGFDEAHCLPPEPGDCTGDGKYSLHAYGTFTLHGSETGNNGLLYIMRNCSHYTVAYPGFPRGGGANPKGGAPTYYLANFSQNCMKMKKFWAGGGASLASPLDPPLLHQEPGTGSDLLSPIVPVPIPVALPVPKQCERCLRNSTNTIENLV